MLYLQDLEYAIRLHCLVLKRELIFISFSRFYLFYTFQYNLYIFAHEAVLTLFLSILYTTFYSSQSLSLHQTELLNDLPYPNKQLNDLQRILLHLDIYQEPTYKPSIQSQYIVVETNGFLIFLILKSTVSC